MDKDQKKSEIVRQFYQERLLGTLIIGSGFILIGYGIYEAVSRQNPTMLCLSGLGALSIITGKALRTGARIFGQRAFDQVDQEQDNLPPGQNY